VSSQIQFPAALDDRENKRAFLIGPLTGFELRLVTGFCAGCPGKGAGDRSFLFSPAGVHMRAIVETDEDVRAITHLELNAFFRREQKFPRRTFRVENDPFFGQAAKPGVLPDERVRLKST